MGSRSPNTEPFEGVPHVSGENDVLEKDLENTNSFMLEMYPGLQKDRIGTYYFESNERGTLIQAENTSISCSVESSR